MRPDESRDQGTEMGEKDATEGCVSTEMTVFTMSKGKLIFNLPDDVKMT